MVEYFWVVALLTVVAIVAVLRGDLADSQTRLATAEEQLAQARADLAAAPRITAPSVATAQWRGAQGSGVAMDAILMGYCRAMAANEHVIDLCTGGAGTPARVRHGGSTPRAGYGSWEVVPALAPARTPVVGAPMAAPPDRRKAPLHSHFDG